MGLEGVEPTTQGSSVPCSTKLSYSPVAEAVGFEPTRESPPPGFQPGALDHSATPPFTDGEERWIRTTRPKAHGLQPRGQLPEALCSPQKRIPMVCPEGVEPSRPLRVTRS